MQEMHNWFDQINTKDIHPSQLFDYIASALDISPSNPLHIAGTSISKLADNDTAAAYHNYIHTSEAMAAMYELASAEFKNVSNETIQSASVKTKQELILAAVITMAGHDVLHDGLSERIAPPGSTDEYKNIQANRLEIQSANKLNELCKSAGVEQNTIAVMTAAIQGTAVKNTNLSLQNRLNYKENPDLAINAIAQLATEADLAASISHIYGPPKGELLATEATNAENHALATGLVSTKGREWFLKNACHLLSTGSKETGLINELNNMELQLIGMETYLHTKFEINETMHAYDKLGLSESSDKPNTLSNTDIQSTIHHKLNTRLDTQSLNFSL